MVQNDFCFNTHTHTHKRTEILQHHRWAAIKHDSYVLALKQTEWHRVVKRVMYFSVLCSLSDYSASPQTFFSSSFKCMAKKHRVFFCLYPKNYITIIHNSSTVVKTLILQLFLLVRYDYTVASEWNLNTWKLEHHLSVYMVYYTV